jgi:outer membrane protein assembly factor BamB
MNILNQFELIITQTLLCNLGTTKYHVKKVILLLTVTLCFGINVEAQKDTVIVIGQKMDGTTLSVPALHFRMPVFTFDFSDDGNRVCIGYRKISKNGKTWSSSGELSYLQLDEHEEWWCKPINYDEESAMCLTSGVLLSGVGNTFYGNNGELEKWRNEASLFQINNSLNLALGYKNIRSNKLCAYSLTDGSELWNTKVSHEYGWNDQIEILPSHKLVVADNLYRINLSTGETFQYPLNVGKPDVGSMFLQGLVAVAAAGIGAAVAGGQYYYAPMMMNNNVITGMVSNICQNDSVYYIADRNKVSCVDTLLHSKWTCQIPDNLASHSELFVNGDRLYMLNMGYGLKNGSYLVKCGKPFLASYDIHTGKQIYMNTLSPKKNMIEGAIATENAFFMLFDNGLVYQNVVDTTVSRHDWNVEKYGKLCQLLTDTVYVIDSIKGNFTPVYFDGANCSVYSDNGHLYVVDKDLNIKADYPRNLIYVPCVGVKDYFCVNKDDDFWFIHKLGLPVAHFNASVRHSEFIRNKLMLLTDKNDLLFIDLNKIL